MREEQSSDVNGRSDLDADDHDHEHGGYVVDDDTPMSDSGFISPFPGTRWQSHVTSEYGPRTDPKTGAPNTPHKGIDLGYGMGTKIHAVASGTVLYVKDSGGSGYGKHLAINHGGKIITLYGHCSEILVSEGQHVDQGDVIAKVGSTGKSTGPHLHLEFIVNGVSKNPRNYLPK